VFNQLYNNRPCYIKIYQVQYYKLKKMTHNTLQWRPPELQEFKSWLDLLSELQPLHHQGRSKRPHQVAMIQYTNIYCNILYIFILIIAFIYIIYICVYVSRIFNYQESSRSLKKYHCRAGLPGEHGQATTCIVKALASSTMEFSSMESWSPIQPCHD